MSKAFVILDNGSTEPMKQVRCKNEDKELQQLLERNMNLLPGDQIKPDDPRRWLQIEREMPVPDPTTGTNRWSIDFFLVDQSAMPTLVECKRFEDTRSRREVIGQMMEYAANGHYYWTKDILRESAEKSATRNGLSLDESILGLQPDDNLSTDAFFQQIEDNLQQGQIRMVFFLEEAPMELKSVVDFLNKQMQRSEILIVEARQYSHDGVLVVVPTLFGYTDEARLVKKTITVTPRDRKKWDSSSFFADVDSKQDNPDAKKAIREIFDDCKSLSCEFSWGSGVYNGSFQPRWSSICPKAPITVYSNGGLAVNFGSFSGDPQLEKLREHFKDLIKTRLGLTVPDDCAKKYPGYKIEEWQYHTKDLIQILKEVFLMEIHDDQPQNEPNNLPSNK